MYFLFKKVSAECAYILAEMVQRTEDPDFATYGPMKWCLGLLCHRWSTALLAPFVSFVHQVIGDWGYDNRLVKFSDQPFNVWVETFMEAFVLDPRGVMERMWKSVTHLIDWCTIFDLPYDELDEETIDKLDRTREFL